MVDEVTSSPSATKAETVKKAAPVKGTSPIDTRVYGRVKWYNCKFNYGFICRLDTKEDLFVHRNGIKKCNPKKFKSLCDDEIVMFDVVYTDKGPEARNVTGPEGRPARPSRYAKYRPWYLELIQQTEQLTIKEKRNPVKDQRRSKSFDQKQKKKTIKITPNQPKNSSVSSSEAIPEDKENIDGGYASKSSSDNDKNSKQKRRNKPRSPKSTRKQEKTLPIPTVCHCCGPEASKQPIQV